MEVWFSKYGLSCLLLIVLVFPTLQSGCESPILSGNSETTYKGSSFVGNNEPSHCPIGFAKENKGWCVFKLDEERWIEVDLGVQYVLKRLDIKYHAHLSYLLPVKELIFSWSETGEYGKWNTFQTAFKTNITSGGVTSFTLSDYGNVPMTAQNVRLNITDPNDGVFCLSIEMYGCSAKCSNTACRHGYQCTVFEDGTEGCDRCLPGFLKKGSECIARSPCEGTSPCHLNASCVSHTPYDYACICKKDFMGDGQTCTRCGSGYKDNGLGCVDINECETGEHKCQDNQYCINTDGSYVCQCKFGFKKNDRGTTCHDIDECEIKQDKKSPCPSDNTKCINKEGYFMCECIHKGYVWYGEECTDIDECKANLHKCKHADCVNTDGGYRCTCRAGYRFKNKDLLRRECIDTNECLEEEFQKLCETMDGTCKNTIGSFKCVCQVGFMMDNTHKKCIDRDECKQDKPCSENAFCRNLQGEYRCTCKPGFAGDGRTCVQDLASSQEEQNKKVAVIAGSGGGVLLLTIAIVLLIWACCKKKKKTMENDALMVAAFDPGFDVGFGEVVPDEQWQQYDEFDYDDDSDDSDDSDIGTVFESSFGQEARNH